MNTKTAKIINLLFQIFAILGEIIVLLLSPDDINNQITNTTTEESINDTKLVVDKLVKSIDNAVISNSLLTHNIIMSKENEAKKLTPRKRIIIVCCDGGGIKGVVSLTILMELAKQMGIDIIDKASLVSGTSTGSLIVSARSKKLSYDAIMDIYKNFGKVIFKGTVKNFIVGATLASSDKKKEELVKVFEQVKIGDFSQDKKLFVVVSKVKSTPSSPITAIQQELANHSSSLKNSDVSTTGNNNTQSNQEQQFKTKIITNYNKKHQDILLVDALNASSAAPLFFSPVEIQGNKYVDGGIGYQNNPILLAHKEALKLFGDKVDMIFISIGTGSYTEIATPQKPSTGLFKSPEIKFKSTILNTIGLIKNAASSVGDSETPHQIFKQMIGNGSGSSKHGISHYYRFNPKLSQNFSLSDSSTTSLTTMENETRQYMTSPEMMKEIKHLKLEIESFVNTSQINLLNKN